MTKYMCYSLLGRPCQLLTVENSNTQNITGVYESVHNISCNLGYVTLEMNTNVLVECQHNGTWNVTSCRSELF